jgi:hypothetical protein
MLFWMMFNTVNSTSDSLESFMVFNITFNNISVISWQSVLLVEGTGVPGENNHVPQVTDKLYHMVTNTCVLSMILYQTETSEVLWLTTGS